MFGFFGGSASQMTSELMLLSDFSGENKLRKCFNNLKNVKCDSGHPEKRKKKIKTVLNDDFKWRDCVVDFRKPEMFSDFVQETRLNFNFNAWSHSMKLNGISDPRSWKPYTVKGIPPGLVVIPGAFEETECKYWYKKLLDEIPFKEASKLRSNVLLPPSPDSITPPVKGNHAPGSGGTDEEAPVMLRWISFGYFYDWNTKKYSNDKEDVPQEIERLMKDLTSILGFDFKPEAGVINYYNCKSRLSAHVDQSEGNLSVPLVSLSFGSDAILIVGGLNQNDESVIPLLLRSGDVVIMSGDARLIWHSVPKVFCENHDKQCKNGRKIFRINLNVRQVN